LQLLYKTFGNSVYGKWVTQNHGNIPGKTKGKKIMLLVALKTKDDKMQYKS